MASRSTRPNGDTWIFVKATNGKRRAVRLGSLSPDDAEEAERRLSRLERLWLDRKDIDPLTAAWVASLSADHRERVERTGLIAADRSGGVRIAAETTLDTLIAEWSGTLDVEPQTLAGYLRSADYLRRYFGADRDVTSVLPADADKFKAWAINSGRVSGDKPLSRSTISRSTKTWRAIFEFAVRLRWTRDNPFDHLPAPGEFNEERAYYITPALVDAIIERCPHPELRAMLTLSRYASFRGPSEFKPLTWRDVDFAEKAVRITAPKTKRYRNGARRLTPLCDRSIAALEPLFEAAPEGAVEVFPELGGKDSSLLSQRVAAVCRPMGLALWVKPWINLRASCETDWQAAGHSIFETAEWMGHSPEVALRHYNRVAKDRVVDLPAALREGKAKQSASGPPKAKHKAKRRG